MRFASALGFSVLLLLLLAPPPLRADAGELGLPVQHYHSPEDYNGYSQITAITHTAEGFTVIGTYAAAIVYDGHGFEKIPFAAAFVTALHRAADDVIWAGSDNDIGVLAPDPATHRLRFESRTSLLAPEARAFGRVRAIEHTRDGLFATTTRGVLRFHAERAEFIPFNADARLQLFALGEHLYLQNSQQGLLRFDGRAFVLLDPGEPLRDRSLQLAPWSATHALCLVNSVGCFTLEFATDRLTPLPTPLDPLLKKVPINQILRLRDGRYALLRANNSGLLLTDPALQGAQLIDQSAGLATGAIFGGSIDSEDGLWLALGNGLTRLDLAPGLTVFDERTGVRAGGTLSIVRQDGQLYAGTSDGLLRLEPGDPATGRIARFVPDPRVRESCLYLASSSQGLVVGTNHSVDLLAGESRRTVVETHSGTLTVQRSTRAPDVHFISADDGSFVLDLATGVSTQLPGLTPGLSLWNFAETADGSLWAGSSSAGLWHITPAAGGDWAHARLENFPLGQAGLPTGKNWTATFPLFGGENFLSDAGTHRWDPATRTFPLDQRYRAEGGEHLRFFPVLADDLGRAWTSLWFGTVACSRPLGYFAAEATGIFQWHDAPARWSSGVGRWGAQRMLLETGPAKNQSLLWTKSLTSLTRIELATLPTAIPAAPWRPVLRQFTAAERVWPAGAGTSLRLPFSNAPITLRYAAPRFRPGANVRYETRLVGFRDAWSAPSPLNETVFTNLIGGPFTFEVRARDGDGLPSETARITFSVAPPWSRRPLAYALYALALASSIFGYVRWRLGRSERERLRLTALVEARTADLALARDAAEAASRAKSHFVASMSHELRTPLNSIIGYAQILALHEAATPWQRERLGVINTSGAHLLRLINDVLDFARVEAGRLEVRSAPFDLGGLLGEISAAGRVLAENKKLLWRVSVPATLPAAVVGDPARLRQVLDNLLGNAVKFTPEGEVALTVARRGALYEFTVRDTGAGIAPDDQARLFHAFEQTAGGASAGGAGLGLAISRQLAERMGGTLAVRSTPGSGSAFTLTLPLPDSTGAAAIAPAGWLPPRGYPGPRRAILVLDDVAQNRAVIRDTLEPLGFTLREAADAPAALVLLAAGGIDLLILDLRLPGEDGFAFARRLRATSAHAALPILAMSASVLPSQRADALAAGADLFLPKPFALPELLAALELLLKLTWLAATPPPAAVAPAGPAIPPPRALLAQLTEHATLGDIAALQLLLEKLAAAPGQTALAAELTALLNAFQLAALRQRLATLMAAE